MKTILLRGSQKFDEQVNLYLTSGYVPRTFAILQTLGRVLAACWIYLQVGSIKVVNGQYLGVDSPVIYCANHSSMFDPIVLMSLIRRICRYMTAVEEMQGVFGLKAIFMGSFGSFAVDRSRGKTVIEPAIKVVAENNALILFPEAKIAPDGLLLPFKPGAALIANGAYRRLGQAQEVFIVPLSINYGRRHNETARSSFWQMGLKWRGGVTVIAAKPLKVSAFNGDVEALTESMRLSIATNLQAT